MLALEQSSNQGQRLVYLESNPGHCSLSARGAFSATVSEQTGHPNANIFFILRATQPLNYISGGPKIF